MRVPAVPEMGIQQVRGHFTRASQCLLDRVAAGRGPLHTVVALSQRRPRSHQPLYTQSGTRMRLTATQLPFPSDPEMCFNSTAIPEDNALT